MPAASRGTFDASTPARHRVVNALLGGKDNFAADRAVAAALLAATPRGCPDAGQLARSARAYAMRSVAWLAGRGVTQVIAVAWGLPFPPDPHTAAGPEGVTVYAGDDPVAMSHLSALAAGPRVAAVVADPRDPAAVLGAAAGARGPGGTALLDLGAPVAVVACHLPSLAAARARRLVRGLARPLAPGSALVIACPSYASPDDAAVMEEAWSAAGEWHSHDAGMVASWLAAAGLVMAVPGDGPCWPPLPVLPRGCAGGTGLRVLAAADDTQGCPAAGAGVAGLVRGGMPRAGEQPQPGRGPDRLLQLGEPGGAVPPAGRVFPSARCGPPGGAGGHPARGDGLGHQAGQLLIR